VEVTPQKLRRAITGSTATRLGSVTPFIVEEGGTWVVAGVRDRKVKAYTPLLICAWRQWLPLSASRESERFRAKTGEGPQSATAGSNVEEDVLLSARGAGERPEACCKRKAGVVKSRWDLAAQNSALDIMLDSSL